MSRFSVRAEGFICIIIRAQPTLHFIAAANFLRQRVQADLQSCVVHTISLLLSRFRQQSLVDQFIHNSL